MLTQLKSMLYDEILCDIDTTRKDEKLYLEKNFNLRLQAIDYIEFHVIDRIDAHIESTEVFDQMNFLKQYAEKVKGHLEDIDKRMFHELRRKISSEDNRGKLL